MSYVVLFHYVLLLGRWSSSGSSLSSCAGSVAARYCSRVTPWMVRLSCMNRPRIRLLSYSVVMPCLRMLTTSDKWMTVVATCRVSDCFGDEGRRWTMGLHRRAERNLDRTLPMTVQLRFLALLSSTLSCLRLLYI